MATKFQINNKVKFTNFYGEDCGTRVIKFAKNDKVLILWNLQKGHEAFDALTGQGRGQSKIEHTND